MHRNMMKIRHILTSSLTALMLLATTGAFSQTLAEQDAVKTSATNQALRESLVNFAKGFLGVPFRYASAAPEKGFDCSGFANFIFKNFNIDVPHSSKAFINFGRMVKPEEFKVGDILVFYSFKNLSQIGHVGIICEAAGMNSKFIHSSSGKIKGVVISELNPASYAKRFYQCVDIMGDE